MSRHNRVQKSKIHINSVTIKYITDCNRRERNEFDTCAHEHDSRVTVCSFQRARTLRVVPTLHQSDLTLAGKL